MGKPPRRRYHATGTPRVTYALRIVQFAHFSPSLLQLFLFENLNLKRLVAMGENIGRCYVTTFTVTLTNRSRIPFLDGLYNSLTLLYYLHRNLTLPPIEELNSTTDFDSNIVVVGRRR
jgi:hypothetical protein